MASVRVLGFTFSGTLSSNMVSKHNIDIIKRSHQKRNPTLLQHRAKQMQSSAKEEMWAFHTDVHSYVCTDHGLCRCSSLSVPIVHVFTG